MQFKARVIQTYVVDIEADDTRQAMELITNRVLPGLRGSLNVTGDKFKLQLEGARLQGAPEPYDQPTQPTP
jgi:hypothetical protein